MVTRWRSCRACAPSSTRRRWIRSRRSSRTASRRRGCRATGASSTERCDAQDPSNAREVIEAELDADAALLSDDTLRVVACLAATLATIDRLDDRSRHQARRRGRATPRRGPSSAGTTEATAPGFPGSAFPRSANGWLGAGAARSRLRPFWRKKLRPSEWAADGGGTGGGASLPMAAKAEFMSDLEWGDRRVSNPRQLDPQSSALPAELRPPKGVVNIAARARHASETRLADRLLPRPRGRTARARDVRVVRVARELGAGGGD